MANKHKYFKTPVISLVKQKTALINNYKNSTCRIDNNELIWTGKIKPTSLSKEYTVLMCYKLRGIPKVWVYGDELENLESTDFPHKYDIDIENKMVRICLYTNSEFDSSMYLANTIIPWTIEWLYYYEIWLVTGEWLGGGIHPEFGVEKEEL